MPPYAFPTEADGPNTLQLDEETMKECTGLGENEGLH
jgi:hypothetical protein